MKADLMRRPHPSLLANSSYMYSNSSLWSACAMVMFSLCLNVKSTWLWQVWQGILASLEAPSVACSAGTRLLALKSTALCVIWSGKNGSMAMHPFLCTRPYSSDHSWALRTLSLPTRRRRAFIYQLGVFKTRIHDIFGIAAGNLMCIHALM
jgi:hypothetical protein